MGKPSARVRGHSNGGADDDSRSPGNTVFPLGDISSTTGTDKQARTSQRAICDVAEDPVGQEAKRENQLLFREFAADTSLHGIKYFANPEHHKLRRFVWLILFLAAFAAFVITTIDHLQTFYKFDVTTSINYETPSNQTLPAITICNYNAFKKSAVIDSGWESLIPVLLPYVTKTSTPQIHVDLGSYEDVIYPEWDANEINERWGHRIQDMLLECQWKQGYNCGPQDFKRVWTDLGPCYTFNGGNVNLEGGGESPYVANGTASEEGLWMRLNLEQYDYLATPYDTAGFKILIHGRNDVATFVNPGIIHAAPGFTTVIPLTKTIIKGQKSPYVTNCTDGGLNYFATYTPNTCLIECLTVAVLKECNCFLPWVHTSGVGEICDFETTALCAFNALVDVDCSCNMPCLEEQYLTRVSMTATPAQYAVPVLCDQYNMTEEEVRNNIVDLYIYFEDMRVTVVDQKVAYTFYDLTSDVGGEIGLLLGASVLTLFEFLDYIAVYQLMGVALLKNCYHQHFGKKR